MEWRNLFVLVRFDLARTLRGAKGILFLFFSGLFYFLVLKQIAGWAAAWLAGDKALVLLTWLIDNASARALFHDAPAALSAYLVVALGTVPVFAMWGSCDQTATDLGNKHLRFLVPRCGRSSIYFSRFISAALLVTATYLAIGTAATVVSIVVDDLPVSAVLVYGMRVNLSVILLGLPFVALMALCAAATASSALSVLVGGGSYFLVNAMASVLAIKNPQARSVTYLFPSALKNRLIGTDSSAVLVAGLLLLCYTAAYLYAGWLVFRRRDL